MKRFFRAISLALALFSLSPVPAQATQFLVPVGAVVGLQLRDDTVTVAAFDDSCTAARDAGIRIGDQLVKINDTTIDDPADVRAVLEDCTGDISLTVRRGGKTSTLRIAPKSTAVGSRLGVYLRQGIAGIGTVTFYDPETGICGTLGHGVSDSKGHLLSMKTGTVYEARIESVLKGKSGQPGQLKGSADINRGLGTVLCNTAYGVFSRTDGPWQGQAIPVADFSEVRTGPASIMCTVSDAGVQEYSVEVLKIYPRERSDGRNYLLKVTDPDLLAATGGIVQGMSGSPIIQDGKLIGAVTHVLVNAPDTGYGIFIGNMLSAAE